MSEKKDVEQLEKQIEEQEKFIKVFTEKSIDAFYTNELETDKLLTTLSTTAIGFIKYVRDNGEKSHNVFNDINFTYVELSVTCFSLTICIVLVIFILNRKVLSEIVATRGNPKPSIYDSLSSFCDNAKLVTFFVAVLAIAKDFYF